MANTFDSVTAEVVAIRSEQGMRYYPKVDGKFVTTPSQLVPSIQSIVSFASEAEAEGLLRSFNLEVETGK